MADEEKQDYLFMKKTNNEQSRTRSSALQVKIVASKRSKLERLRKNGSVCHSVLFVDPLASHNRMHIVGDIVAFINAVDDHAFSDRDDLGHGLVQEADDGALVAAVGVPVGDEGKQLIGKFLFISKKLEDVRHNFQCLSWLRLCSRLLAFYCCALLKR